MGGSRPTPMMRIIGATMAGVTIAVLSGCYTLQVAQGGDILNGTAIALDITDAGRVALGGLMGPEIAQIEGRLQAKENDEYTIAVTSVRLFRGGEQIWKGEQIKIRTEFVSRAYERRLSPGRSVVAGAVGAGVVLFLVTRAIVGSGLGDEGRLPVDTLHSQRRPARP